MTNPTPDQDLQEELALLPDELDELGEMEVEEAGTPVTFDPDLERPHTNQPPKTETP